MPEPSETRHKKKPEVFVHLRERRAIRAQEGELYTYPVLRGIYRGLPVEGSITHDGRALLYMPDIPLLAWPSVTVRETLLGDLKLALARLPEEDRKPQPLPR